MVLTCLRFHIGFLSYPISVFCCFVCNTHPAKRQKPIAQNRDQPVLLTQGFPARNRLVGKSKPLTFTNPSSQLQIYNNIYMIHTYIYIIYIYIPRASPCCCFIMLYSYFIGFILNIAGQTSLTGQISPLIWRMTSMAGGFNQPLWENMISSVVMKLKLKIPDSSLGCFKARCRVNKTACKITRG